jgi:hypothetical protein
MAQTGIASILDFAVPTSEPLHHFPKGPPEFQEHIEFSGPGQGWPPYPVGWSAVTPLETESLAGGLTDEVADHLRLVALGDDRVRELLGERFAHINTDALNTGKNATSDCAAPVGALLTFFSHSNNVAVEVSMQGAHVEHAQIVENYQPPEGNEEINEAICLARSDRQFGDRLALLAANAILLPMRDEQLGFGNRLLWITFTDPKDIEAEKPALFTAVVDMAEGRVLFVRPEPPVSDEGEHDNAQ